MGNGDPVYRSDGWQIPGSGIVRGTVIATFDNTGFYPPGDSGKHVAIYLSQGRENEMRFIEVYDQWIRSDGSKYYPKKRKIYAKPGYISNNAEAFSVVYTTHPGFQKIL